MRVLRGVRAPGAPPTGPDFWSPRSHPGSDCILPAISFPRPLFGSNRQELLAHFLLRKKTVPIAAAFINLP